MPKNKMTIDARLHTNTQQGDGRERVILYHQRGGDVGMELLLQFYDKHDLFPNGANGEEYTVTIERKA